MPEFNSRRQCLRLTLGAAGFAAGSRPLLASRTLVWRERMLLGLGTTMWLRAGHADDARLDKALDVAVQHLRDIDGALNLFDDGSEVSRLNRHGHLASPSPHLVAVLNKARQVAGSSKGLFDVTVQPLWRCWWEAAQASTLPSEKRIRAAQARIDWRSVQAGPATVRFTRPAMAITLNGIAQGYAADQVAAVMRAHGIEHALLDTGEWALMGRSEQGASWTLGLENPASGKPLLSFTPPPGFSVAMSTNAMQLMGPDHHHIINPLLGNSPTRLAAVAVVATSATLADALTKPLFMGNAAQALAMASTWQAGVITIDREGRWAASPELVSRLRVLPS